MKLESRFELVKRFFMTTKPPREISLRMQLTHFFAVIL